MVEALKLILIGMVLGVSNVIPGVSGGTMAVVFGIYDKLISVITINVKKLFSMWKFWLPLGIGMVAGILLFSSAIMWLFEHYPMATNWFFIGLIIGSIPLITGKIQKARDEKQKKPTTSVIISFVVALAVIVLMMAFEGNTHETIAQTVLTTPLFIQLLLCSAIAAIAMIIPGISGSFILLALGVYTTIIAAISDLNIMLLIPVALGVLIGLLSGAKLVRLVLEKIPAQTYGAILGLIIGSVVIIFPGFALSIEMIISVLTLAVGFALAYFTSKGKE